jgi:hypothetical protein
MIFSVPPWQALTTNFLLAPDVRLGLLHAIFALLTITDLAMFSARRSPLPLHPGHQLTTLTHGHAPGDAVAALRPLPRLLLDHRELAAAVVVEVEGAAGVRLDLRTYTFLILVKRSAPSEEKIRLTLRPILFELCFLMRAQSLQPTMRPLVICVRTTLATVGPSFNKSWNHFIFNVSRYRQSHFRPLVCCKTPYLP